MLLSPQNSYVEGLISSTMIFGGDVLESNYV